MRGRVRDGNGQLHNLDFTRDLDFVGWQVLTAQLPAAPGPFTLDRLWMVTLGASAYSDHSVYFYNLQTLYAPPHATDVPRGSRFRDRTQTHGEFRGIPGGGSYVLEVPGSVGEYRFNREDNMAIIQLAANAAGLTERGQWGWLLRDVRSFDSEHVVILMALSPLDFTPLVQELFHEMLRVLAEEGRMVFAVSAVNDAAEAELSLRDGVRYINLPKPDGGNAEIRFWTDGRLVWWYG
jgi:hypothetical protein